MGGEEPQSVNHRRGEGARDAAGAGWGAVQGKTLAGVGSLGRRWRRPRGLSQAQRLRSLGSSRLFPTPASEAKRGGLRSWRCWSHKTLESNKSEIFSLQPLLFCHNTCESVDYVFCEREKSELKSSSVCLSYLWLGPSDAYVHTDGGLPSAVACRIRKVSESIASSGASASSRRANSGSPINMTEMRATSPDRVSRRNHFRTGA